jgi:hypothetical protein
MSNRCVCVCTIALRLFEKSSLVPNKAKEFLKKKTQRGVSGLYLEQW